MFLFPTCDCGMPGFSRLLMENKYPDKKSFNSHFVYSIPIGNKSQYALWCFFFFFSYKQQLCPSRIERLERRRKTMTVSAPSQPDRPFQKFRVSNCVDQSFWKNSDFLDWRILRLWNCKRSGRAPGFICSCAVSEVKSPKAMEMRELL